MSAQPGAVRPCVLLVEDDPSVARFVAMALETLPVRVQNCASVEAALAWLECHRAALVITDLMMPGESGAGLLRRLHDTPALAAGARIVVLSAGLDHAVRQDLAAWGAWRALSKPVPVAELEACVREALADVLSPAAAAAEDAESAHAKGQPAGGLRSGAATVTAQEAAIQEYFAGNAELFHAYREGCIAQFVHDAVQGDLALEIGDLPALRRLCHSLASVLRTLGRPADGLLARTIEIAARDHDVSAARHHWALLRRRLAFSGRE
ncbi:response regulator [Acidovorax sp. NCPPB 2350]|nr:response regulator [Acidovorax sp. NCPPB 2350]